jgi:hypothetical protein
MRGTRSKQQVEKIQLPFVTAKMSSRTPPVLSKVEVIRNQF